MNSYNPSQTYWQQPQQPESLDMKVSAIMKKVYVKMLLALLVSAATSLGIVLAAPEITLLIAGNPIAYFGCAIMELILVFVISARLTKMSEGMSTALFYLFSALNGLTLSILFIVYEPVSILKTFVITAGVFGAMSVYGYTTNRDLTKIGSFLFMALIGLIICSVVNMFWGNDSFSWIISGLGVLIFIGLTAWDTQKIKKMAAMNMGVSNGALATWGALSLYLDFVNLFIYLLRFFGKRN